jgi:hypothetical protein
VTKKEARDHRLHPEKDREARLRTPLLRIARDENACRCGGGELQDLRPPKHRVMKKTGTPAFDPESLEERQGTDKGEDPE